MMKQHLILYFVLAGLAFTTISCDKESKDLTVLIVGEYIGEFGSTVHGELFNYEIVVTKISKEKISIKPKSGTEFEEFEADIAELNDGTIGSPPAAGQVPETIVLFTHNSIPQTLSIQRNLADDQYVFVGEKK